MAADPLVYCLERLTDYAEFERLCHDLVALDHPGLEPLGGFNDMGRDAIHVDRSTGTTTIFAYSVREDWRTKLEEDAEKVRKHGHACDRLVFLSTANFSAGERDRAVAFVRGTYGWVFELYGLERLGSMLRTSHHHLIARHPAIFTPPFFAVAGGLSLATAHDHVLIDHDRTDAPLAHWLARRLMLAGYNVWCRDLAPVAGESVSDTVRGLLKHRAFAYVAILSGSALRNSELNARRAAAHAVLQDDHRVIIPATATDLARAELDQDTQRLESADFSDGWAAGLQHVLRVLQARRCPRAASGGIDHALNAYSTNDLVRPEPEPIVSNLIPIVEIPQTILRFRSREPVPDRTGQFARRWAFRATSDHEQLAFHAPPADMADAFGIQPQGATLWRSAKAFDVDGVPVQDLIKELLKKALIAECLRRGLGYCTERDAVYFPSGLLPHDRVPFTHLDGSRSFFLAAGDRGVSSKTPFKYHLAPTFVPRFRIGGASDFIVRVNVRITDANGRLFPGHTGNARRKKLCKNWWNGEWLKRLLGVVQFLETEPGRMVLGSGPLDRLTVTLTPRIWSAPVRLDEAALTDPPDEDEVFGDYDGEEDVDDVDA